MASEETAFFFEETLSREDFFHGRVIDVHRDRVRLVDGSEGEREVVDHPGGVVIAAVDEERNIFLVEQYRYAMKETTLELPAGKLEYGEDPLLAAVRELGEETGLQAESIEKVGSYYATPGFCSERLHLYLAAGLTPGQPHPDCGELLRCRKMPLKEAVSLVCSDEIRDGKTKTLVLLADRLTGV